VPNYETASNDAEQRDKRQSAVAERLSEINIHEIAPEDIEFMNQATQEYMRDHFPVPGELIDQIPDHIKIVDSNTFRNLESEIGINDINLDGVTGIYSESSSEVLINADASQSPEQLYATMFRESTHYVSINNGAGYSSRLTVPNEIIDDPESADLLSEGYNAYIEGATQSFTMDALSEMGIDTRSGGPHSVYADVFRAINKHRSPEAVKQEYFTSSNEQIRREVEATLIDDPSARQAYLEDERAATGAYAEALIACGLACRNIILAADRNDRAEIQRTYQDIERSMQYYQTRKESQNV